MKMKRFIAMILAVVMMLQTFSFALEPKDFDDFPKEGHWSYEAMCAAVKNRLLQGKGDGVIAPTDNLTRAEFSAIITRAFGATRVADITNFKDVTEGKWYYEDKSIAKVKQMAVMEGVSETAFNPDVYMTRQEVFVALSRALVVSGEDEDVLAKFDDKGKVSDWAKKPIIGMVDNSYVNGYEQDGEWTLKPTNYITREELAQVFHNLFGTYISDYDANAENRGVFGGKSIDAPVTYHNSVVVRVPNATLQNAIIEGDLVIADGVGSGNFDLKNVMVKGRIVVRGGEGKVTFSNVRCDGQIIIYDVNGTVNFNNYRDEAPFAGENKLVEMTPATFLERKSQESGGGGGGGGGNKDRTYSYKINRYIEPLEEGKTFEEYALKDTLPFDALAGTVVYPLDKVAAYPIHGFEIDENGPYNDSYESGKYISRNNMEFEIYYKRLSYAVSFEGVTDDAGVEFPDIEARYETELEQSDLPQNVKTDEGVTFEGWSTDANAVVPDETIVVEDETKLYPVYTYDVTFVVNGDERTFGGYKKGDTVGYDNIPDDSEIEMADDKKLGGWSTDEEGSYIYNKDAVAAMVVTAPVKLYPVIVDKDDVEYVTEHYFEELDGTYVKKVQTSAFDKPSHEVTAVPLSGADLPEGFEYYADHADKVESGIVPDEGTLTLKLYYNRKTYEVTFTYNNEDGEEEEKTVEVKFGDTVDASDVPDEEDVEKIPGKTFEGWSTDANATEPENLDELEITDETKLYPVYKDKEPVEYTVEHYFENLDGTYSVDDSYTVVDRAVPDFEVVADKIVESELPEGFEYVANADELLSAVLPDEGITLKVYYNRKTFTISFGVDGYVAKTYKYGEALKLEDIPEDDEVEVPEYKQFMGWATEPDKTAGASREELAGTEVTGSVTYYPAFGNLGDANYKKTYYFEEVDGTYTAQVEYLSGTPGTTVTMEKLPEADVPEGFEYYAHADEKTSGVIEEDGSLELAVYYNRKTFTISFGVDGYVAKTYKYGEALKLEDIPEDDEVEVPEYKQFMGWATEPDKTAGASREELAGTEVTGSVTYYPAFGNLGEANYKKVYYFEELDGTYTTQVEYLSGTPGTTVTMEKLPEADIPVGFEYYAHADEKTSGVIEPDGSLELAIYYNRKTFTVKFDGFGEETFKYGYELTLSDIPENDDVVVPEYKQFMGWATEPDKTAGASREELAGTEVTGSVTYYPAFGNLGDANYKKTYYFEEVDGTYTAQTEYLSGTPGTTVTMEKLPEADIPVGFEYYAHADEKTSGVIEEDGSLELAIYYNRKTFTVIFEGYSEETYKYGYELTLSDIPEDDEITVADDKKFVGWSTDKDATDGIGRDEIAGTVVESDLTYYPIIVEKDMVVYYVEHYFEELERNDDGTAKYELYETTTGRGKIGTSVAADYLEEEGFEKITHEDELLSGQIPKEEDGVLTLKVYYNRKLIKVNFFDPYDDYYDDATETYEQPTEIVEVRYGTKVSDEENLEKFEAMTATDFYRGTYEGFWKDGTVASVYTENYIHEVPLYWWYEDAETGKFKKFYVEGRDPEEDLVITSETDVYMKVKKITLVIESDEYDFAGIYDVVYDDETRFFDTIKDAIFVNEYPVTFDVGYVGIEDKFYGKIAEKNLLVNVDGNYEIININKLIRFAKLMGEDGFAAFLDSFIDEEAMGDIEEYLFEYIMNTPTDETAVHLKKLVDDLVVEHKDIAYSMIAEIAEDIVAKEITHVEEFFMTYTTSLVEAGDTDDLEKMICDMFKEYKKTNENEFVGFVSDVIVKALSEDVPNNDIVDEIEKYIKSEVKKGTFNEEIVDYIMGMSDEDFKNAATSVIKEDVSIIEEDVENKILTDDGFVDRIIDEIFALDSETVDKEIKKYIKDYNLADEYIKNNPDVIADYITDAHLEEFYPSYVPGVTFTKQEKIDAIEEYINDNPDTAIEKLKGYVGKNLDKVINDYYDNHKSEVKDEIKTEVLVNGELRQKLCDFAMKLIKDDEFSDLLDFAIDDYLTDVLADDGKKRTLAEEEVERLKNNKVYNLAFVQDAIDTVIDDVIEDIRLYGADGDDSTESEYVADIKNYAKSLNDFTDIVDAFVHADEEFRNDIIVNLFDNLYASDPEHKIILQFMEKVTDKMIDEGDIDINILVTIIDYIKDSGEHGHTLTYDIIEGLMELDDEIVEYAEEHLGWLGNAQLAASLKFRREATYDEMFEVTPDNLFIMDMVKNKVDSMTFDKFLEDYVYGTVPESLLNKLPLDALIGQIYEDSHQRFIDELDTAVRNVENGMDDQWVHSGFIVSVNPVQYAIDMYDKYLIPGYEKANEKAESFGGRVSEIYLTWYRDNPYIDDLVNLSSPELYVDGTANDSEEETSGYYISSFEDIYHNVLMPSAVLTDDILVWYLEKVDFYTLRDFAKDNEDLILAMYNHPNVLAARYAKEGFPETIEDYYDDLMEDDAIREAFEKIENKVPFEMEAFVQRFITNETLDMYYYKGLERVGMKAEDILGIYDEKDIKKEITSEDFDKMLRELEEFWIDGNSHVTTDYVFDGFYHNIFSIFSFEKTFKGYTVSFERAFIDG